MAHIVERERADGEFSFVVRWRARGVRSGKYESEIFSDPDAAERFMDLVNGFGQQWPPGWIRGQGFVEDIRSAEEMFEAFALKHIGLLTGVQGDTKAKYRRLVEQNMSPWFKSYSVRDGEGGISREMVQRWVNDLAEGTAAPLDAADRKPRVKYKAKTIANQHGLLHAILQAAVDAEPKLRATNPCGFTRLPRLDGDQIEEEMVFLEREEYGWIYECLAEDAQDLSDTLAETGGRWGEVTALQPRDLQRRHGRPVIRIHRAWKRDEDGKAYLGAPKTKRSRRTIVVSWKLFRKLTKRAKGKAKDSLLFTGPQGGRWDAGTFRRLRWVPAIELAVEKFGLIKRPRIHDLRHSHAAWLIAAKVPLPAIQARLGHESITTTVDRYGHLLEGLDEEIMAALEWAMNPDVPMSALAGLLAQAGLTGGGAGAWGQPLARPEDTAQIEGLREDNDETPTAPAGPVFVVTFDGREIPFAEREHAQQAADQWNDDHAGEQAALRAADWPEDKVVRLGAVGPEERPRWTGGGVVWVRVPERQFVYYDMASYEADGSLSYTPFPGRGRWTWEFESDSYTAKAAEYRLERRPGGAIEAHVRGVSKEAVAASVLAARSEVLKICSQKPGPQAG